MCPPLQYPMPLVIPMMAVRRLLIWYLVWLTNQSPDRRPFILRSIWFACPPLRYPMPLVIPMMAIKYLLIQYLMWSTNQSPDRRTFILSSTPFLCPPLHNVSSYGKNLHAMSKNPSTYSYSPKMGS